MASKAEKLARLRQLTEMAKQVREAKIGRLTGQSGGLRTQISELDAELGKRDHQTGSDAARQAGADLKWQRWVDGRKIKINQKIAQLAHEISLERDALRLEFGRAQVAEELEAIEIARAKREQQKRAEP